MTLVELANLVYSADQIIAQCIHDGIGAEELQRMQDANRANKIALLMMGDRVDAIAEVV